MTAHQPGDRPRVGLQALRLHDHHPRPLLHRRQGRDRRLPRPQRRRQDHHHAHDRRLHRGHVRPGDGGRLRHGDAERRGRPAHRLPARAPAALRRARRLRLPALRGQGEGRAARRHRRRARAGHRRPAGWRPCSITRSTSSRRATASASGWRRRCSARPRCCCSTSPPPASIPGQIQETREVIRAFGERSRGAAQHPHPRRGDADLPARGHHQPRPAARDRLAGRPAARRRSRPTGSSLRVDRAGVGRCARTLLSVDGVRAVRHSRATRRTPGVLTVDCQVDARDGVEAAIARAVAGRWDLHRLERRAADAGKHLPALRPGAAGARRARMNGTARGLPEGARDLLPLADRLLRGRGVPARHAATSSSTTSS